jgi:hypothetical protein
VTRLAAGVVSAGTALGVVGRLSDGWPDTPQLLFALGSPWVVVAVLAGVLAPGARRAVMTGAATLLASVVVYYVVMAAVESRVGPGYALAMIVGWGGLALIVGAVFGVAGSTIREGSARARSLAAALVGGVLSGEALLFLVRGSQQGATVLLLGQLAIGLALGLAFAPPRRRARLVALLAGSAGAAFVIDAAARILMRRYGWGGV